MMMADTGASTVCGAGGFCGGCGGGCACAASVSG